MQEVSPTASCWYQLAKRLKLPKLFEMPRHRRNKRRRNKTATPKKTPAKAAPSQNASQDQSMDNVVRACFDDSQRRSRSELSSYNTVSPSTPPPKMSDVGAPLDLTPIKMNSFNVTNLNILFDSNFVHGDTSEHCGSTGESTEVTTADAELIQTPRVSKVYLVNDKEFPSIIQNRQLHMSNEVNINPYLKEKIRVKDNHDVTFFNPQMFNLKASTPISKICAQDEKMPECSYSVDARLDEMSLMQTSPKSSRSMKIQSLHLSQRKTYKPTPRYGRRVSNISYSSVCIRRRSVEIDDGNVRENLLMKLKKYSKLSAKWSMKVVDVCAQLGISLKNLFLILLMILQSLSSICHAYQERRSKREECKCEQYQKEIGQLNGRIQELTTELVVMRTRLEIQKEGDKLNGFHESLRKVQDDLKQIVELKSEVESLKAQFANFKGPSSETTTSNPAPAPAPAPATLVVPTIKITEAPAVLPPPPPPPPMPALLPPPPPPPMPTAASMPSTKLSSKGTKHREAMSKSKSDSRPMISLDEILKVKLKKPADRPTSTPQRRSAQPVVSMDMLRQVRLRPASRPPLRPAYCSTPTGSTTDLEASTQSTSPHSSLSRLLNDGSVWRVKRLRKASRYSLDSVHRSRSSASLGAVSYGGSEMRERVDVSGA
ncbi:uncharacterized protein LOC109608059 isoform X2 [Aethina tumida]|uniref:uncharacterized protein LOC109608059 isoform X2 n=1 Tax=Aethina tumida TaxID=116153 RepID=UPI0021485DF1|nr:uncharacterized protein LOC109608059 isoform X2 [Aethina tumida]